MFIQHIAGEAHNMAKMDRKPRRNIQYKDLCKPPPEPHPSPTMNPGLGWCPVRY